MEIETKECTIKTSVLKDYYHVIIVNDRGDVREESVDYPTIRKLETDMDYQHFWLGQLMARWPF